MYPSSSCISIETAPPQLWVSLPRGHKDHPMLEPTLDLRQVARLDAAIVLSNRSETCRPVPKGAFRSETQRSTKKNCQAVPKKAFSLSETF